MGTSRRLISALLASLLASASACGGESSPTDGPGDGHDHDHEDPGSLIDASAPPPDGSVVGNFAWSLPPSFPRPNVPADNPMSAEKVELGRRIFYDKRLSDNQTQSCASCHKQERAFADERAVGLGSTGELHTRGPMSLANVAYNPTFTWSNPVMVELERQALVPIFGDDPIELGMHSIADAETRFRAEPIYAPLFAAAFPDDAEPITAKNIARAIAAFERTLISGNAPFDRWQQGDEGAISEAAKRGNDLFNSERLECFHCHQGFNFTDHVSWEGQAFVSAPMHQTGLYNIDGQGGYPFPNIGAKAVTDKASDMGKFKAPTLRNIVLTAPYMHDGSIATLDEVLDHYAKGGRARSKQTDPLLVGFTLTEAERADLKAFFESLTDQEFITNPKFSDPWLQP